MWHEARKQEKKIRGMMVDYKRRAERRRDYYERIKQDPAQFLQVHGRPAKIHLDPAVASAADSPATMMPWQGSHNNLIDRFDVRAHLDIIPDYISAPESPKVPTLEDRKACYERYRTLVQNDFMGVNEDKFLHQIFLEERFGPVLKPAGEEEKKKLVDKKAAIGYVYEDSTIPDVPTMLNPLSKSFADEEEDEDERDDLSDIDLDITVDVSELSPPQCTEMNEQSLKYGMVDDDFITYLLQDKDEADQLRLVKEIEEEKAMFSGRKSRRERRALREKKLAGRRITSPPSYAARESPTYTPMRHSTSKSRSRSRSPPNAGKIMFITSFGGEASDGDKKSAIAKSLKDGVPKKASKETRPTKTTDVIGPQLPVKNSSDKKSSRRSRSTSRTRKERRYTSRSSSSNRRESDTRDKKRHSSRGRTGRSRRSSSSSSSSRSRARSERRQKARRVSRSRRSSRSRSISSKSRSRSQTKRPTAKSRSKSKSPLTKKSPSLPPPPVKSYYRHSLSRSGSNQSDSGESSERKEGSASERNASGSLLSKLQQLTGKAGPTTKSKLTPQERLKRKMQLALNRQYKADKRAQVEKSEKQLQERMDRAEELRDMAIKLRQRERERRHKMRGYDRNSDSDSSHLKDDVNTRDEVYSPKPHRSHTSTSSDSDEGDHSKANDKRSSRWSRSPSPQRPSQKSPPRDHRRSSAFSQSSSYRKEESTRSPVHHRSRRTPPRRSPNRHSPRRTPPRNVRPRSPPRTVNNSRDRRYDSYHRSPSRSPPRYSSQYDSRRGRRSRSPYRRQSSHSRSSWLVDY